MTVLFIFARQCNLKRSISQEIINTLEFMTRSHDYNFVPSANSHPLFQDHFRREVTVGEISVVLESSWRFILKNCHRNGEEDFSGIFGSDFQDYRLCFRHLVRDDIFFNVWYMFGCMIASISETSGFIGYYIGDVLQPSPKLVLILFENGYVFECPIILRNSQHPQNSTLDHEENDTFELDADNLPDMVKLELERQANDSNSSLEEYLLSVVYVKELVVPVEYQEEWKWQ